MDIQSITDINQLKSIAYDQVKLLNQTQMNIQILEKRIEELESIKEADEPKVVDQEYDRPNGETGWNNS